MPPQAGLKWETTLFGSQPQWTIDPSIEVITRLAQNYFGEVDEPDVKFLAQGAFNKTYVIALPHRDYIMRVSLPVDPRFKTLSEVAVLDYLDKTTSIPIPKVITFDASSRNALGFEWILMNRVIGDPLSKIWDSLSLANKLRIVEQVVQIMAMLFQARFPLIGNIFAVKDAQPLSKASPLPGDVVVDRIVSMPFFWDDRLHQNIFRGPFRSSSKWLQCRLTMTMNSCNRILERQADEDEVEDAEVTKSLISRLSSYMSEVFPPSSEKEEFAIHHDDISAENILVCAHNNITALIDWECVSCLPLWKTCQFPFFLRGRDRGEKPREEMYARNEDGTLDGLFFEHTMEYEKTVLRKAFLKGMAQTEPQWIRVFKSSTRKADFDFAVENCDNPMMLKRMTKWLDNISAGEKYQSLRQLALS